MTKIHRVRPGAALFLILSVGYGATTAQACDSWGTARPGGPWGRPAPVVRDHRSPYGSAPGGVIVTSTSGGPIVRDHRSPPVVRDHRR
ncbi:hypothetical protein AB4097_04965 [Microvirga sp. 2MCAF35]|uniref:hypothetical protein n=1 Tax=Microvirga sp. 2MCAF35 TaxID=3232987 RepID=UPI003F98E599